MTPKQPEDDVSDRTVIRTSPRSDHVQASATPGSATVFDPSGGAWPAARAPSSETVFQPAFPIGDAAASRAMPDQAASPRPADRPASETDPALRRGAVPAAGIAIQYGAANPILSAAAPLLILLGRLRLLSAHPDVQELAEQAAAAIEAFELKMIKADAVSSQDADAAKYVLCETADDIVRSLPGHESWGQHSMLARYYGAAGSGTGFFEALNQVLADPAQHCDLLELMHACLSLGFQGQYRGLPGGDGALQRVRADVYETLRYFRQRLPEEISPHWQGSPAARPQSRRRVPLWGIAAAAVTVVTASFFGLRTAVTADGETAAAELLALNPATPVIIERSDIAPVVETAKPEPVAPPAEPAPSPRIDRIRAALSDDIQAGRLTVGTKGDFVVIEISNQLLFAPGSVKARKEFQPVAARIAAALEPEAGPIRIVGHTDNVKPKKSSAFKSNFDLSVARAKAVAALLAPGLHDASRVSADGKGDDEPIDDNATAEGRAKNRRVDVMIARETPAADQTAPQP